MLPSVLQRRATDHIPVLAEEVRRLLAVRPGETVVDGTFGAGGHAALLAHAKLGRDVVVAGVHDHLEIWDRDAWRRELAEVEGSAEDVAERLANRD